MFDYLIKTCSLLISQEFMLCRTEYENDPRKCLLEGKEVTACAMEFFRKMKENCFKEFQSYAQCLDNSSIDFQLTP